MGEFFCFSCGRYKPLTSLAKDRQSKRKKCVTCLETSKLRASEGYQIENKRKTARNKKRYSAISRTTTKAISGE